MQVIYKWSKKEFLNMALNKCNQEVFSGVMS